MNWRLVGLVLLAVAICYCWSTTRIERMIAYQTPAHPIMHGNYYTFHDMSEQWDQGKRPGTLNIIKNSQYNLLNNPYLDYAAFHSSGAPLFCDYYDLDIGFLFPVDVARRLFTVLPDNFLRTLALQVLVDLCALFVIFAAFHRWGWLPASGAALLYAWNVSIGMQSALAFYYFWDAIVALAALLLVTALYTEARGTRFSPVAVGIAAALGVLCGFGVWLRASWAIYSIVLIAALFAAARTRRYALVVALLFVAASAYPVTRATRLMGHFSLTTRQSWAAAFEALGKDPNAYGLENDDQFLYDFAREKYGAVDAACQGVKRDAALRQEYLKIWNQDRGFVIRSIANRIYLGVVSNGGLLQTTDRNMLVLALLGGLWMLLRGGSRRLLAVAAASLFAVSTVSICLVYFMTPHYNGVPQICLILLAIGVFDLLQFLVGRGISPRKVWRRFVSIGSVLRAAKAAVAVVGLASLAVYATFRQDAVREYFTPPVYVVEWLSPAAVPPGDVDAYIRKIHDLPSSDQRMLAMVFAVQETDDDAAWGVALRSRLRRVAGLNVRGPSPPLAFDVAADSAPAIQQALWHSEHFVLGFTLDGVSGFDVSDPSTWSGQSVTVQLRPDGAQSVDAAAPVFLPKFARRGLQLQSRAGRTFVFRWSTPPAG